MNPTGAWTKRLPPGAKPLQMPKATACPAAQGPGEIDYLQCIGPDEFAKDVGEYVLAPGVHPPIDGIDKAKVIAIDELSDEETRKWGAEFKKIFDAK